MRARDKGIGDLKLRFCFFLSGHHSLSPRAEFVCSTVIPFCAVSKLCYSNSYLDHPIFIPCMVHIPTISLNPNSQHASSSWGASHHQSGTSSRYTVHRKQIGLLYKADFRAREAREREEQVSLAQPRRITALGMLWHIEIGVSPWRRRGAGHCRSRRLPASYSGIYAESSRGFACVQDYSSVCSII